MKDLEKRHPWAQRVPLPESLKKPIVRFYDRFVRMRGKPEEVARGLALGILIGFTPTMGIQMPIALVVASLLGQNKLAALLGVWISNPLTAPFLYGFTYLVGSKVLIMKAAKAFHLPHSWKEVKELGIHIFLPLWVGGLISGLVAYFPTYYFGLKAIKGYRAARRRLKERRARRRGEPGRELPPEADDTDGESDEFMEDGLPGEDDLEDASDDDLMYEDDEE